MRVALLALLCLGGLLLLACGGRSESGGVRDPLRQVQNDVRDQRNTDIRQAAQDYATNPVGFRHKVNDIAARARAEEAILTTLQDRDFPDPTNVIQQHTERWFALFDQAEAEARATRERATDVQNRLEGRLIAEIGEAAYRKVLENVYAVTDLDAPPLYRELQATKLGLATEGFWDLRTRVWSDMQERTPDLASFTSIEAWKQERREHTRAFVLERVPDATEADLLAAEAEMVAANGTVKRFNGRLNIAEARWIDAGNAALADRAARFGYLWPAKAQRNLIRMQLEEGPE